MFHALLWQFARPLLQNCILYAFAATAAKYISLQKVNPKVFLHFRRVLMDSLPNPPYSVEQKSQYSILKSDAIPSYPWYPRTLQNCERNWLEKKGEKITYVHLFLFCLKCHYFRLWSSILLFSYRLKRVSSKGSNFEIMKKRNTKKKCRF